MMTTFENPWLRFDAVKIYVCKEYNEKTEFNMQAETDTHMASMETEEEVETETDAANVPGPLLRRSTRTRRSTTRLLMNMDDKKFKHYEIRPMVMTAADEKEIHDLLAPLKDDEDIDEECLTVEEIENESDDSFDGQSASDEEYLPGGSLEAEESGGEEEDEEDDEEDEEEEMTQEEAASQGHSGPTVAAPPSLSVVIPPQPGWVDMPHLEVSLANSNACAQQFMPPVVGPLPTTWNSACELTGPLPPPVNTPLVSTTPFIPSASTPSNGPEMIAFLNNFDANGEGGSW